MSAYAFRFDPFVTRMRSTFAPRKPRHRVLRVLFGLLGLAVLALLVMFGLFVGAGMIAAGLLYRVWKQRGKPIARRSRDDVLDGEYRVVNPAVLPR